MKIILMIGLGNPGSKYYWTRHNAGKDFLRWKCAYDNETLHTNNTFSYFTNIKEGVITYYIIPEVEMNNTGVIFNNHFLNNIIQGRDQANSVKILSLHDDLGVPLGDAKLRMNEARAPRGHNGNRSIIEYLQKILGNRYIPPYYLSIGIGRPGNGDVGSWVLGKFNMSEKKIIENLFFDINDLLTKYEISEKK